MLTMAKIGFKCKIPKFEALFPIESQPKLYSTNWKGLQLAHLVFHLKQLSPDSKDEIVQSSKL